MRRFTLRAWALALITSALALDVQAGGPATVRGQSDSPPPPSQESVDKARASEYKVYQERLAVCFKLREIALQTKDDALSQQAEKLEAMAWKSWEIRTQKLSTVAVGEAPPAEPAANTKASKPKTVLRAPNGRPIREDNP